ncbi:hypothetical protein N7490_003088 [Penicillium lividum]|nr:hypothetical protein N7490_003088 [Penicillium lividum]
MILSSWVTAGLLALSCAFTPTLARSNAAAIARVQRPARCPDTCASYNPSSWFVYSSISRVAACNETMLLDFNIFNDLNDTKSHSTIHTCVVESLINLDGKTQGLSSTESVKSNMTFEIGAWDAITDVDYYSQGQSLSYLVEDLETYISANLQKSMIFGYSNATAAGIYVGPNLQRPENVKLALKYLSSFNDGGNYGAMVIQFCGIDSNHTLGVALDSNGDMTAIQKYVRAWHQGECITGFDQATYVTTSGWMKKAVDLESTIKVNNTVLIRSHSNRNVRRTHMHTPLHHRASTCSYIQVVSGDSCSSLVSECDITSTEFYEYNTASDLCSTLAVGQYVCCSSGSLPDFAPSAFSNGTCYTYDVASGDSCSSLADTYSITVAEINSYNNDTWGWYGCDDLQAGQSICLSTGNPPYPLPIANAVCGPQVNSTVFNSSSPSVWATYNPCPLNACCDVWGQCGTTPVYCNNTLASTGAPGTAADGSDGCISNCGTAITNQASSSSSYSAIGYYEASSVNRSCLQMDPSSIDLSQWTHIYFAFGNIASDFSINVDGMEDTFEQFVALSGVKRVISFGGWDFSTDSDTYMIFREGTDATNRDTLAQNIAYFVIDSDLDGVDFDWEYPGEPDISGIPAGSSDEGDNYLAFLKLVRNYLPRDSILSITAPSSYWYLKQFPISDMAEVVDYINYMTYDLHGTWDLDNEWSDNGCSDGNCLFSHVNMTETMWALSMITKAGVATNQIMVGVSSYGRSFHMTTAGCTASDCTWDTGGEAGECTDTVGYISNAELNTILASDSTASLTSTNDTDYIVYNSTQWVGYMTNSTKVKRQAYYETFNFAGTAEWAVDLESFVSSDSGSSSNSSDASGSGGQTITIDPEIWTEPTPAVTCSPPCYMVMPPKSLSTTTTITFPVWNSYITWRSTAVKTTTLIDNSTETYKTFATYTIPTGISIAPVQTNYINVWYQQISSGQTAVYQTSSVEPSPFAITFTPTVGGNTTVIGGTTSTISGVTFSTGNITYTSPPYTGVYGGITYVSNGTVLAAKTSTVTPHPYPTTTNTTPDPDLNTRTTTVKAQSSTSSSGPPCATSSHCGGHCLPSTDALAALNSVGEQIGQEFQSLYASATVSVVTATSTSGASAATTSNPLCLIEQDPDSGTDGSWCSCSGSDESITTMSGSDPCGYTTIPTMTTSNEYPYTFQDPYGDLIACKSEGYVDNTIPYCTGSRTTLSINPTDNPYPYTFLDPYGDTIACATEGFVDNTISYCSGSRTTISTVTPTTTSYPWAIWSEYEYTDDCVDSHCVGELQSDLVFAGPEDSSDVCSTSILSVAENTEGYGITGLDTKMKFIDGICGNDVLYWCNQTSSDTDTWTCADENGDNPGQCVKVATDADQPSASCFDWKRFGDTFYYMVANCTGPWECT